jgi:hypothetical protein
VEETLWKNPYETNPARAAHDRPPWMSNPTGKIDSTAVRSGWQRASAQPEEGQDGEYDDDGADDPDDIVHDVPFRDG